MKKTVFFFLILFFSSWCFAFEYQTFPIQNQDDLDELFMQGEISEQTRDNLSDLLQNPLDVNSASVEQLYELPGITLWMAKQIVKQRNLSGTFNRSQFMQLEFITPSLFEQITPFITFQKRSLGISFVEQVKPQQEFTLSPLYSNDHPLQSYFVWRFKQANHHAGLLLTQRELTQVQFNPGSGYLASNGPDNYVNFDAVYYADKHPNFTWILGNYNAGFAHGLTFHNSPRRESEGLSVQFPVYQDQTTGRIHQPRKLLGTAMSMRRKLLQNDLITTVFFSNQRHDLYQYDIQYGADQTFLSLLGECDTPGQEQFDFTCGEDGQWHSNQILDEFGENVSFTTIRDAFDETLAGTHVAYQFGDNEIGATHYQSTIRYNFSAPDIVFSPSATYPQTNKLHSTGINAVRKFTFSQISFELSRSQNEGWANYVRWLWSKDRSEYKLAYRFYHARYANPHNKAPAARDEYQGLAQSNEEGMLFEGKSQLASFPYHYRLDLWRQPFVNLDGKLLHDASPLNALFYFQIKSNIGTQHLLSSELYLLNKDIENNGRGRSYESGDEQGERRKWSAQYRSKQWWPLSYSLRYQSIWQDIASANRFHREFNINAKLNVQLKKHRFGLYHTYYNEPLVLNDDDNLRFRSYVHYEYKLSKISHFKMRLGYITPQNRLIFLTIFKLSL